VSRHRGVLRAGAAAWLVASGLVGGLAGGCVRIDVSSRPARVAVGDGSDDGADARTRDARVRAEAGRVLDAWHDAAARGDYDAYFGRMTRDAVFLGTDKTERWVGAEFRDWARPYFDGPTAYGEGAWTYRSIERHVDVSSNGNIAWADEVLWNEKYGHCRGTAVLRRSVEDGRLRVAHYGLAFLVPNEVAAEVTARGMAFEAGQAGGASSSAPERPAAGAGPVIESLPRAGGGGG
jgi:ketosteroid isomerase-like protein